MKKLITIADWASDTLTCQEFKSVLEGYLKDPNCINVSSVVTTPSTIHTAFLLSQVTETEERYGRPQETVVFQNTDPRLQSAEALKEPAGAEFVIARLQSGIFVCGPNAGFNFSLLKGKIDVLFHYEGLEKGTQFRSRDLFSRICAHLMDEMEDELELEEIPLSIIPELRGWFVGHVDNFGNIKTTITMEDFKGKYEFGEQVKIKINNIEKHVKYVTNLFGSNLGDIVIYPGSSGTKDNPYLEVSVWRHFTEKDISTGWHIFNNPRPGEVVYLST